MLQAVLNVSGRSWWWAFFICWPLALFHCEMPQEHVCTGTDTIWTSFLSMMNNLWWSDFWGPFTQPQIHAFMETLRDSGVTTQDHVEDSNEDIAAYIKCEAGLLVEVDSCYHVSRLLIYIKYAGRVWIGLRIHFITHQTCRRSLWKEHEWCNKQFVIHVLEATLPAAWNDALEPLQKAETPLQSVTL